MLYDIEISPNTQSLSSGEVFKACATADVLSFKVQGDDGSDQMKYLLQFREKGDKTKVDNIIEGFERLGCQVDIMGIQKSPTKETPINKKSMTSTTSSKKSGLASNRPKSA
jgi:hypothetical protein